MAAKTPKATSDEARDALAVQLEDDLLEDMSNLKSERAADMLIAALEKEGYKIVPIDDGETAKEEDEEKPDDEPA